MDGVSQVLVHWRILCFFLLPINVQDFLGSFTLVRPAIVDISWGSDTRHGAERYVHWADSWVTTVLRDPVRHMMLMSPM